MKYCKIELTKPKSIELDEETIFLINEIRKKVYIYWNDQAGQTPTEQQVIKAAIIKYLNEIDNVIKKE